MYIGIVNEQPRAFNTYEACSAYTKHERRAIHRKLETYDDIETAILLGTTSKRTIDAYRYGGFQLTEPITDVRLHVKQNGAFTNIVMEIKDRVSITPIREPKLRNLHQFIVLLDTIKRYANNETILRITLNDPTLVRWYDDLTYQGHVKEVDHPYVLERCNDLVHNIAKEEQDMRVWLRVDTRQVSE